MLPILILSFYIGTIFGSFATVLIERWHSKKWGIFMGRSECPHCNNILKPRDLFPIFSYLWNKGKCRYCHLPISSFYIKSEIIMGLIFMILTYSMLNYEINIFWIHGILLIVFWFITGVYILYDIQYTEIPDQIMIPALYLTIILPIFFILFTWESEYIFHISLQSKLLWALILYTFFYVQILIPGWFYLIRNRKWSILWNLILSYITFPFEILFSIFNKNKQEEEIDIPTWIGGGDLRLALFIWLTLGMLHGFASFIFAYILGSIIWICLLTYNIVRWRKTQSKIPFWPFLWVGWLMSVFFYKEIELIYSLLLI